MKTLCCLLVFFSIAVARGQSTNAPAIQERSTNAPASFQPDPLTAELSKRIETTAIAPLQPRPNEMSLGEFKVSGIAIEATKTKQPFSLLDPFSPPPNSSSADNLDRWRFENRHDENTLNENGLKVFTIHF
jgi:hypothetical protein